MNFIRVPLRIASPFVGVVVATLALHTAVNGAPTTQKVQRKPAAPATQPAKVSKFNIVYKLGDGSDQWDAKAKDRIVSAMDAAVEIYNKNGEFNKKLTVTFSPATPTADGNYNGSIRFGGQIGTRTALHEIAHTLGIGQHPKWKEFIKDGKWTGENALAQLREFDGPKAELHADKQHFWPYGLNQEREGGEENFIRHVKMVAAIRRDLGIVN